ncbi:hypothetical protein GCM10028806_32660 [Spirosoma terrae]|uniref:OmpA family protein n=1 Tax=Spirosoma terrae TaxID=1968276 RepID=A0A6L9LFZ2_9BACT|nr:OmpA family protein [Spirosoma terrae]NDU95579.1 OmpA family protein [Spirosoma terrae]
MKRTYSLFFASYLLISSSLSIQSWGQNRTSQATQQALPSGEAMIEGSVIDAQTRQPIVGAIVSIKSQDGRSQAKQQLGANGSYQFRVATTQTYIIVNSAQGYETLEEPLAFTSSKAERLTRRPTLLYRIGAKPATQPSVASDSPKSQPGSASTNTSATSATASPPAQQPAAVASNQAAGNNTQSSERVVPPKTLDAKVTYTPPLVVAPKGKATQLQALQFVQSKSELLPEAQGGLEQLLQFMQQHPTAEIELSGHTDNQGDFDKNVQLSKERVDVVKSYLVQNGIAANRITTRGYGPTRPIASNNSEATRRLNRRVELILLKQ